MERTNYLEEIEFQLEIHPACALLGPRQVGKTTLAEMYAKKFDQNDILFLDLENPLDLARLENPMLALNATSASLVLIDEVQRRPDLFPVLRVLIDKYKHKRKFLILGSASRDLIHQSSESLAGRIGYIEVAPFSLNEAKDLNKLWSRGGFPLSYLAKSNELSYAWRQAYISTFLERDLSNLGFNIPPQQMRRFWIMLAHYHGQLFNSSELAKSLGVSDHTIRRYLDILAGTFMIRILQPWHENLEKRQIKTPKIYFRDSGILHALLGIQNEHNLLNYPKLGSFWEGFALEQIIQHYNKQNPECYFWRTHAGAELDLLLIIGTKRIGFEVKYTETPKITLSMRNACTDLELDHLFVIYPGEHNFPLSENISACGLNSLNILTP